MALMAVLLAVGLAWVAHGHPVHPGWAGLVVVPMGWAAGLRFRIPKLVFLGFVGLVGLAASGAVGGNLPLGLGVLGLALLAWDGSAFRGGQDRGSAARRLRRSVLVVCTGLALAFAASLLRFSLNFWVLLGGLVFAWLALWAWLREVSHSSGGNANGNRSTSGPTR